ncbi:hypothetical protein C8R46DRAFT_1358161 [Mycena filopes]|nr:hypothetical protein C8R46DRAFT_1358161 [Mycena filopes]
MSRAPPALDEIYTLVGLRSLQHLVFDGRRWSAGQILAIMGHCTPALERLEFRGCDPQFTLPSSSNAFQRPKIRHLGLHDSSVVGVLADPAFPVDISALTYLQCKTPAMSLALLKLIFPVQSTIKTLEFQQTLANDDPVDLALFPALFPSLQHLNLGDFWVPVSDAHMHPHIRMLVRLPAQNSIHTVSISLFLHAYATQQWGTAEALRGDLRALHAALTADNLSALRRVEVAVDAASALRTLGLGEAGWRGIVEDAMPGLRKRRVLLICAL